MKTLSVAIIAHVDHGKTTLTDHLLKQGGAFESHEKIDELVMDSNTLEKERGITIFAKNCSVQFQGIKINIVDTPGHADFSSEVERVLKMVDAVILVVDAKEGPMPQTKFVLAKSLKLGLRPIVVINKIDKPDQRADEVVNMVFDLFVKLGASNEQLDFPIIYAIAREGIAKKEMQDESKDLTPLFEQIVQHVPLYPESNTNEPLQLQVSNLGYDDYVGRIAIGRIHKGKVKVGQTISLMRLDGTIKNARLSKVYIYQGIRQTEVTEAEAGEIVALAGLDDVTIGETIADTQNPVALPPLLIDEPTLSMNFLVNNSPFAGKEGKYVTTRHIKDRLDKELQTNVGLKVETMTDMDGYKVSGRGELHLSILLENMRREGYEVQVSQPEVILKREDGKLLEPYEQLIITVPEGFSGAVIEKLGKRKGEMIDLQTENGQTKMEYSIPTRGLLGFRSEFIKDTKGEGLMDHSFAKYDEHKGPIPRRNNGTMISGEQGKTVAFALWNLQERGKLFVGPVVEVYVGMIIGENSRADDLVVNPCKEKKLTNMRTTASDESIKLTPPLIHTLETALEFISDDELVEITPLNIRLRKKQLNETDRKRNKSS